MRDRTPKGRKVAADQEALAQPPPACLARFSLNHRTFQLLRCQKRGAVSQTEMLRFDLDGVTVSVVEDVRQDGSIAETCDLLTKLTGRELQIATLVAAGDATKNIAHKLRISEWTVIEHLRRICAKLKVNNRAAMVYRCAPLINGAALAISTNSSPDTNVAARGVREVARSDARHRLRSGNLVEA
jgi:DNA-binding CsgD family transcriptional regulator